MPVPRGAVPMCQPVGKLFAIPDMTSVVSSRLFASLFAVGTRLIGAVLLLAAMLKTHALMAEQSSAIRWFEIALVEIESIVGLALVLGFHPIATRRVAFALFLALVIGASDYVISGARSCACFGQVDFAPWAALALDGGCLIALWCWRPSKQPRHTARGLICLLPLSLLPFFLISASALRFPTLLVAPGALKVFQASRTEVLLQLQNPHDRSVTIETIESSCPCLSAPELPWSVPARGQSCYSLALALDEQPAFSGLLLLELKASGPGGVTVFSTTIRAQILPVPL